MIKLRRRWQTWLAAPAVVVVAALAAAIPAQAQSSGPAASGRVMAAQAASTCDGQATGGTWWADTCWQSPNYIQYFTEEYGVPTNPSKDGALINLWGGLEDKGGDTVLQNVLTWGAQSGIVSNPNIWYITPWYRYGSNSVHGSSVHVAAGDTIYSILSASDCDSSGDCTWQLTTTDANSGLASSYTITSGVPFTKVLGAVMTVPMASGCVETPANGHAAFRNLSVTDSTGATPAPAFTARVLNPQCSISVTGSPTGGDILWKP